MNYCKICKAYTLKPEHCNQTTIKAGYKFIKHQKNSLDFDNEKLNIEV